MFTAKLSDFTEILDEPTTTPPEPPQSPTMPKLAKGGDSAERKARAILYAAKAAGAAEGGRNASAYSLTARLREKFGLDDADLMEVLSAWNKRNVPPLEADELVAVAKNANQYANRTAGSGFEPLKSTHKAQLKNDVDSSTTETLPLIRLSSVKAESVSWLWANRFPNKGLNLIPGVGSAGKTTFAAYLMACLTTGRDWIDCQNNTPAGSCLFIGAEDDLACAIRPKLDAAGADVSKVVALDYEKFFLQGESFNLSDHVDLLDKTIEKIGDCRAVFFDPLNGYLGKINSYSDSESRSVLIPLQNIAKKYNIAIYGLCHLNKKSDLAAVDRVLGSVAFVNTSRAVWFIVWDKETDIRYLTHEKSNYSINPTNLSFKIIDGACSFIEGTTDKTADDVLQGGIHKADSTVECTEWLKKKLAYNSVLSSEISDEARHCGFSDHALRESKRTLKVQSKPNGIGGKWMLSLPQGGV